MSQKTVSIPVGFELPDWCADAPIEFQMEPYESLAVEHFCWYCGRRTYHRTEDCLLAKLELRGFKPLDPHRHSSLSREPIPSTTNNLPLMPPGNVNLFLPEKRKGDKVNLNPLPLPDGKENLTNHIIKLRPKNIIEDKPWACKHCGRKHHPKEKCPTY